jgi:hypothetical protein
MRRLPGLQDVSSDLQVESTQMIVNVDRQKGPVLGMLRGITISFKLAPRGSAWPSHTPNPGHGKAAGTSGYDYGGFLGPIGPLSDPVLEGAAVCVSARRRGGFTSR